MHCGEKSRLVPRKTICSACGQMKLSLVTTALLASPGSALVAHHAARVPRVQMSAACGDLWAGDLGEVAVPYRPRIPYSHHANSAIKELKAEASCAELKESKPLVQLSAENSVDVPDVGEVAVPYSNHANSAITEIRAEAWYAELKKNSKKEAALKKHKGFMASIFGSAAAAEATESLGLGADGAWAPTLAAPTLSTVQGE